MSTTIERYVNTLRARLSPEIVEELHGHVEDIAADLQRAGLGRDESEREAVRRFGAATDVATVMAIEQRAARAWPARWRGRLRRARRPAAALLVATALACLGGSAVASAHTPAEQQGIHNPMIISHGDIDGRLKGHREGRP